MEIHIAAKEVLQAFVNNGIGQYRVHLEISRQLSVYLEKYGNKACTLKEDLRGSQP